MYSVARPNQCLGGRYQQYPPRPQRATSLDSLCESSASSSDDISDSDILSGDLVRTSSDGEQGHRQTDILGIGMTQDTPTIIGEEYLERSHRKCDYKDCSFRKTDCASVDSAKTQKSVCRKSSTASSSQGSGSRMETIVEEPNEPKISVKEILARFETLRESSETKFNEVGIGYIEKLC